MKIFVFSALGLLLWCFLFVWLVNQVRYLITPRHVKVTLFGAALRRIPIDKIASATKRRGHGLAEYWWSTFRPKHRMLVLRKTRGIFKNVVITPRNRYSFKAELELAMARLNAPEEGVTTQVPVFRD